jgi:hypothetical protein
LKTDAPNRIKIMNNARKMKNRIFPIAAASGDVWLNPMIAEIIANTKKAIDQRNIVLLV